MFSIDFIIIKYFPPLVDLVRRCRILKFGRLTRCTKGKFSIDIAKLFSKGSALISALAGGAESYPFPYMVTLHAHSLTFTMDQKPVWENQLA